MTAAPPSPCWVRQGLQFQVRGPRLSCASWISGALWYLVETSTTWVLHPQGIKNHRSKTWPKNHCKFPSQKADTAAFGFLPRGSVHSSAERLHTSAVFFFSATSSHALSCIIKYHQMSNCDQLLDVLWKLPIFWHQHYNRTCKKGTAGTCTRQSQRLDGYGRGAM